MFEVNLTANDKQNPLLQTPKIETWKTELKEAIKKTSSLEEVLKVKLPKTSYPIFIPKSFAEKIYRSGDKSSLWKQFVPHSEEESGTGLKDPIGDHAHAKPGRIIHRYKNRVLFFPTPICPVSCRYCFRKNELANPDELFEGRLEETIDYLTSHPEVNEVILSGGDPFILSDQKLENIFRSFAQISSVKYLRIHTRTPIIIPSRVTQRLTGLLVEYKRKFNKLVLVIHTNHKEELDDEVAASLIKLKKTGIELLSQSVLLKNVNDDTESLVNLFTHLSDLGVRPYYLHHPDRVKGAMCFYLSLTEGRLLYHSLRDKLSGWMIPQYVIDIPGGAGKVPAFNPETFDFSGNLIAKDGTITKVPPLN